MHLMKRRARIAACAACVILTLSGAANTAVAASHISVVIENDIAVESFDGTTVMSTLMLPAGASAANPVPVVLNSHGFGAYQHRAYTPGGTLGLLVGEGYAVMTWDARGYGESGGMSNMNSPSYEVRDVQALITYLAGRSEILQDSVGDPRVGFIGGSYSATIQLNAAAFDARIDAIVPQHAAGDMATDLTPHDVFKRRWDLSLDGDTRFAPEVHAMQDELVTDGVMSAGTKLWYADKATGRYSMQIRTPTLIIQGTIDTLFPLQDGIENFMNISSSGTPVKLIAYCEGHNACPYPGGASGYPNGSGGRPDVWVDRLFKWLDHYLKKEGVSTGPRFEWQTQYGYYRGAADYPIPDTAMATGPRVTANLTGPGGNGGDTLSGGMPVPASQISAGTATRSAIYGPVSVPTGIVGVPRLEITGSAQGPGSQIAFFELVEVAPGGSTKTVDRQVMPMRFGPGGVDTDLDLNAVAWFLKPGYSLQLEVSTGSGMYRGYGSDPYRLNLQITPSLPAVPLS